MYTTLGNLNLILKMVGHHLKILGKDMAGAVSAFEHGLGSTVEYGLEVEEWQRPWKPDINACLGDESVPVRFEICLEDNSNRALRLS